MNYFKESEFNCDGNPCFDKMVKKFIYKLERARSFSSVPFVITSSWRSKEHNESVGGVSTSSHLKGIAVDISAPTSSDKYEILKALLRVFTRIGLGSNFIHCDMDYDKPQNLIWTY
jgi:zinc D-Ala-D-Ala carboxypeptidase